MGTCGKLLSWSGAYNTLEAELATPINKRASLPSLLPWFQREAALPAWHLSQLMMMMMMSTHATYYCWLCVCVCLFSKTARVLCWWCVRERLKKTFAHTPTQDPRCLRDKHGGGKTCILFWFLTEFVHHPPSLCLLRRGRQRIPSGIPGCSRRLRSAGGLGGFGGEEHNHRCREAGRE